VVVVDDLDDFFFLVAVVDDLDDFFFLVAVVEEAAEAAEAAEATAAAIFSSNLSADVAIVDDFLLFAVEETTTGFFFSALEATVATTLGFLARVLLAQCHQQTHL
jgi:hypothetical protein